MRDATDRVRAVLPASVEAFIVDRTTREVVTHLDDLDAFCATLAGRALS